MNTRFRLFELLFVLLFLYLFLLQIQAIWSFTVDDAYISLRYAKHWAGGFGLLWNLNEPPVEGYSNFSFVALGALSLVMNLNPVILLKLAGLFGLFFSCFFIFFITRFWFERIASFLPCIALLLYKGEIIWAVSGLETTVYQALICGAVYFAFLGLGYHLYPLARGKVNNFSLMLSGLFLAIAGMTRPEAPVLMILFFILIYWDRPESSTLTLSSNSTSRDLTAGSRDPGTGVDSWIPRSSHGRSGIVMRLASKDSGVRSMSLFVLPLLLLYGLYFLWRWYYFSSLLPNSVHCKGFLDYSLELDKNYVMFAWPFMLLALYACWKKTDKRYYFLLLPSFIYLFLLIGADPIVAFDNRLFLPAFVLLLPLALQGLSTLILGYFKSRGVEYRYSLYLVCLCIAFIFIPAKTLSQYRYFTQNPVAGERLRTDMLLWLETHMKKGGRVVLSDAGLIPYYSNLNFIDSYCLNNSTMTQYPKNERYEQYCQKLMLEKPEVIILTSLRKQGQILYSPMDKCLKLMLDQQGSYQLQGIFSSQSQDATYRYELFTKL